jgi:hypothetical protein
MDWIDPPFNPHWDSFAFGAMVGFFISRAAVFFVFMIEKW